jgi:hypothetical protein
VTELLHLPQHVLPLFGLCLGWPADDPQVKPRLPAALVVHENSYQPVDADILAQYDAQIAAYYTPREAAIPVRIPGAIISGAPLLKRTARSSSTICINKGGQCANSRSSCVSLRV